MVALIAVFDMEFGERHRLDQQSGDPKLSLVRDTVQP
jgi:hypothetical protein